MHLLIRTFLAADLLLLGTLASVAAPEPKSSTEELVSQLVADSQKHQIIRKSDPKDPLRVAETMAVGLADDLSAYNRWMLEIIQQYVKKGQIEEAEYLVGRLPGHGAAMAHAEMALHYARKQQKAEADTHLQSALRLADQASGLPAEMARTQCILALHHLDRSPEAAPQTDKLGKFALLSLETQMHEEDLLAPISVLDAKRQLVGVPEQGEDERRARFLLACAKQHYQKGTGQVAQAFLEEVGAMSVQNGLPNAQHVLVDLARVAWAGGNKDLARKSLNLFLKCCMAYGDGADWKVLYLADAVELLIEWNEMDEAREWLKAAEKSIPKIFVMDAPASMLALARQHERLGDTAAADQFVLLAAKSGASYNHPRVRAETSVRIALYFFNVGKPMSEEVLQILSPDSAEAEK